MENSATPVSQFGVNTTVEPRHFMVEEYSPVSYEKNNSKLRQKAAEVA